MTQKEQDVVDAIALYVRRNLVDALAFLSRRGYTVDEAVEIIARYDHRCDQLSSGTDYS